MSRGGGGQPPQQSQGDGTLDFLWIMVLGVAAVLIIWYFFKSYIIAGISFVKFYEIIGIKHVIGLFNNLTAKFRLSPITTPVLDAWLDVIRSGDKSLNIHSLVQLHSDVGKYLRYPIALILFGLAILVYIGSISTRFRMVFGTRTLRESEHTIWPRITPVLKMNLVKLDIDTGPWAMAITPMAFCKKHNLLLEEFKDGKPTASLLRGKAHQIFALQLGSIWSGDPSSLPRHMKTLLAICAARINNQIDLTDEILNNIAASSGSGKPNFSNYYESLSTHLNQKPVIHVMQRHAYVMPMLASMLELARTSGVLATAEFLWLKPLDRKLWYVLNSVGRQTAFVEVAGIFAHWVTESKFQRPFKVPMVDSAVNALDEILKDILYEPEEA